MKFTDEVIIENHGNVFGTGDWYTFHCPVCKKQVNEADIYCPECDKKLIINEEV